MAHHYAFMMKVATKQEPKSCTEAARNTRWVETIDQEMQVLVDNKRCKCWLTTRLAMGFCSTSTAQEGDRSSMDIQDQA